MILVLDFSVQFNSDGVLGLEDNELCNMNLYPNPTSAVLHISNVENATIEIYNILGQVMTIKTNIATKKQLMFLDMQPVLTWLKYLMRV